MPDKIRIHNKGLLPITGEVMHHSSEFIQRVGRWWCKRIVHALCAAGMSGTLRGEPGGAQDGPGCIEISLLIHAAGNKHPARLFT